MIDDRKIMDELETLVFINSIKPGFWDGTTFQASDGTPYTNVISSSSQIGNGFVVWWAEQNSWLFVASTSNQLVRKDLISHRHLNKIPVVQTQPLFGFVMVLDSNWLSLNNADSSNLPAGNVSMISTIFKYFLGTKTKIHTIPYDSRWYTHEYPNLSTWLASPSRIELSPSPVASAAISNLGLTVEEVSLSDPNLLNKVESLLYIPLLNYDNYNFTVTEATNLRKLAAKKGVFLIGEWNRWITYDQYILNLMNFNNISILGSEPASNYTFYAKKLDNTLTTFAVEGDASGYFSGQTDKQTLMTFIDQDGVTVRTNMVLLSK